MWSFYFVILDFLNEELPWRKCKNTKPDDVRDVKAECLANPEILLWKTTTNRLQEMRTIFYSINSLKYEDRPNYKLISEQLSSLLRKEEEKEAPFLSLSTKSSSIVGILILIDE